VEDRHDRASPVPFGRCRRSLAALEKWADLDAAIAKAEKDVPDNLTPLFRAAKTYGLSAGRDLPRAERYFRRYLAQRERVPDRPPTTQDAHWPPRGTVCLRTQGR
jgi:hypothetical protein